MRQALAAGNIRSLVGISFFCLLSVNLFFASVICHSRLGKQNSLWVQYDHCAIYLFIAGTFTPICLLSIPSAWSWFTLAGVWAAAAMLINKEINGTNHPPPSTLVYLITGWLSVAAALPLIRSFGSASIAYFFVGTALYSVGTVFYIRSRRWLFAHGIWHAFVVGGAVAHFFMFYSILNEIM